MNLQLFEITSESLHLIGERCPELHTLLFSNVEAEECGPGLNYLFASCTSLHTFQLKCDYVVLDCITTICTSLRRLHIVTKRGTDLGVGKIKRYFPNLETIEIPLSFLGFEWQAAAKEFFAAMPSLLQVTYRGYTFYRGGTCAYDGTVTGRMSNYYPEYEWKFIQLEEDKCYAEARKDCHLQMEKSKDKVFVHTAIYNTYSQ